MEGIQRLTNLLLQSQSSLGHSRQFQTRITASRHKPPVIGHLLKDLPKRAPNSLKPLDWENVTFELTALSIVKTSRIETNWNIEIAIRNPSGQLRSWTIENPSHRQLDIELFDTP